jgi:hypothetical protein
MSAAPLPAGCAELFGLLLQIIVVGVAPEVVAEAGVEPELSIEPGPVADSVLDRKFVGEVINP